MTDRNAGPGWLRTTAVLAAAGLPLCATPVAPGQGRPPAAAAKPGSDAAEEDALLLSELLSRQLTPLVDRYLEQRRLPEDQRAKVRALIDAMGVLSSEASPAAGRQREEAIAALTANADTAIETLRDPRFFLQLSTVLIRSGIERDANTLEYWGTNPRLQVSLRPTAEAALRVLQKAAEEAGRQRDAVAAAITPANQDAMTPRYLRLDTLATTAEYTRDMAWYYLALTYDPVDARRRGTAEVAIQALKQYDTPESQVQPVVRLRLGKLHLLAGGYDEARRLFASIATNPNGQVVPAPDVSQQFEARYFAAVTELLAGHLDEAAAGLASLRQWAGQAVANDIARKGADAAAAILEYRIVSARAAAAAEGPEREKLREQARGILTELVRARPDLRSTVYDQLLSTLPPDADVRSLDPLMLAAVVRQGDQERLRPAEEKADAKVLERALAAARELVARRGQPGVADDVADVAWLLQGFFLDRLERRAEAADTFLDYLESKPASEGNARLALDSVLAIIDQLRSADAYDDGVRALQQRVLPIAIAEPFGRRELAYEYARQLQLAGRYAEAARYFRMVPADDRRVTSARFHEMLALKQLLDADAGSQQQALTPVTRGEVVAGIRRLAEEVTAGAGEAAADPGNSLEQKLAYRTLVAKAALVAADTALRHESDPRRAIALLARFEPLADGLPARRDLLADALLLRVNAHMDLDQPTEATGALVGLLSHQSGGQGANIIYTLLQKLDTDLDAARQADHVDRMRALAKARAALSGHLVTWAEQNANPDIRKYTYRYRVFDAGTHHLAAKLETDPAARAKALEGAMAKYEALLGAEPQKAYRQTLQEGADASKPDPVVELGIASVRFDMGRYEAARGMLAELLESRRLGPALTPSSDGPPTYNDAYWQATYELLRCNIELARSSPNPAETLEASKAHLKRLFIQYGPDLGGPRWAPEFNKLRVELIPDFRPPAA